MFPPGVELVTVAEGFESPLWVGSRPAAHGDGRLFVVEQAGRISTLDPGVAVAPWMDISDRVRAGSEQGLLGLAFHPVDPTRYYLNYTDAQGATVVASYPIDAAGSTDPSREKVVLRIPQPASNHNGGNLVFGPDGYLYVGMGDGGGGGDAFGNGQDPFALLGSMLRIDVEADPYAIPPDNPFADGVAGAPEVWAKGLRNPWRFSFDQGLLYVGDVGQNDWEEVDVVAADAAGLNYGWPQMEATHCFRNVCDPTGLVLPVLEYSNGGGDCAVTGGLVYRGEAIPALTGHYLYADHCGGWVKSFRYLDGAITDEVELVQAGGTLPSFGADQAGEIYLAIHDRGEIKKLVPAS